MIDDAMKPKAGIKSIGGKTLNALKSLKDLRPRIAHDVLIHYTMLMLIAILAFCIRMLPLQWGFFLSEFDPYFHYRLAKYIDKHGLFSWLTWHDYKSWYPYGRDIGKTSFPGLAMTAAILYRLLRMLGVPITLYQLCVIFPPIMGALTCVAIYFLARDIGGRNVAILSALFLAINPPYITRTSLGFFDDETVGIFSMIVVFFAFLRSLNEEIPAKKRLLYSVIAGLLLGYISASWGASRYPLGILWLLAFVLLITGKYNTELLKSYAITLGLGLFIAIHIPKLGPKFLTEFSCIPALGVLILLAIYEIARHIESAKIRIITVATALALMAGGYLLLSKYGIVTPISGKFLAVINPLARLQNPLVQSVAEHRPVAWSSIFYEMGAGVILSIIGVYFAAQNPTRHNIFIILYGLSTLYFACSMIRLLLLLAPPLSILWAIGTIRLATPFTEIIREADMLARTKRLRVHVGKEFSIIFLTILFVLLLFSTTHVMAIANTPTTIASATTPTRRYYPDWIEALMWMRYNLPDDAVVCAWWDYGYWITVLGNKTTLADNGTINSTQIKQIATMFVSNETEAIKILKRYGVTHVVVFIAIDRNGRPIGWGEGTKWIWMARIAGYNETEFMDTSKGTWTEKGTQTVIYKLMTYGAQTKIGITPMVTLQHFKLVYYSSGPAKGGVYALVCIYEVVY